MISLQDFPPRLALPESLNPRLKGILFLVKHTKSFSFLPFRTLTMQKVYKIAMVTGAATGFGLATVKQLMASGYKVACCDTSFVHSAPDESFLEEIDGQGSAMFYGMNPLSTGDVFPAATAL